MNLYKKIVTFGLVVCATFIFMSCQNVFSNVKTADNSDIPANMGRVSISVGDYTARTILPNAPDFENYRLEFTCTTDGVTQEAVTIEDGTTSTSVDLAAGDWTITAYGQVTIGETSTDVARGSAIITVEDGVAVQTSIDISSSIGGFDGTFSWSISAPADIEADSWSVSLKNWETDEIVVDASGSSDDSIGFNEEGAVSLSGTKDCAAGYYLLTVNIIKGTQVANTTEIVLIHSGLTSEANLTFTDDDFVDLITISGTISITKNEVAIDPTTLRISMYTEDWDWLGSTTPDEEGNWSIEIEPLAEETSVSFDIYCTNSSLDIDTEFKGDWSISDEDVSGIAFTKSITTKIASGTVSITKNGEAVNASNLYISMYAVDGYGDELGYTTPESDGTWSMEFEVPDESTEVYFDVSDYDTIDVDFKDGLMISDEDISGITLTKDFDTVTVGGTVYAGTSGIDISNAEVVISSKTNYMDAAQFDSLTYFADIEEDGTWLTEVTLGDSSLNVYVLIFGSDGETLVDAYTLDNTYIFNTEGNTEINCVISEMAKASVEISGTITGLSEGTEYTLYCGPEDMLTTQELYGFLDDCISQEWSLIVPIASVSYDAYFLVWCEDGLYKTTSSYSLGTSDQTGIALNISEMDSVDMSN
jgi:hypothetical protein